MLPLRHGMLPNRISTCVHDGLCEDFLVSIVSSHVRLSFLYVCVCTYITSITSITRKLSVIILLDVESHETVKTKHPPTHVRICKVDYLR